MPGTIRLATEHEAAACAAFFDRQLKTAEVFAREFYCPLGVRAAVSRKRVMVCVASGKIIAAVRFYHRTTGPLVSIYQFAVEPDYRGMRLSKELIQAIPGGDRVSLCSKYALLNSYFSNTGWILWMARPDTNEWRLPPKSGKNF